MEIESGGTLLSTMAELRAKIEQGVLASPQRLQLAKAYLESLEWGIKGLETMGQRMGFVVLEKPAPQEYPKMLYRGTQYQIANNPSEEHTITSEGFSARQVEPLPMLNEPAMMPPEAPTFSMPLPGGFNGSGDSTGDDTESIQERP